ncbi:DNA-processing protein DprA [Legionella hackeliae]|uniref:Protein smf (DNA-processing chain A) n=1 Tax=Legionella hackeliae TaxID=449 RepID=A0A0A8UWF4_LEGHA|nr:DNA-processing protein DprA [Legionella hackeliae]KTD12468.1 protein smf [Legionella hackeliae]CEK11881.1 Protein smf (DNA-processing chain A) [Legionella hackeliae]STX48647.1 protein smf [Legionella hackeliae]
MKNKPYLLALNKIPFVGPRTITKLLLKWPNLEELFRLSQQELEQAGIPSRMAQAIKTFNFKDIQLDLCWAEKSGHHLLTIEDVNYPSLLKEIADPPAVLYAIGELSCLLQPSIAMVGSRKPSAIGGETARRFAMELATNQLTIVSGLALGIDAQAHEGCLEVNGKTIAVLGTGIDFTYPRQHKILTAKISQTGLLLSEFPLKTPPMAGHFPRRNRIISGLSLATLVVEAAIKSGSLITARFALEQNRDVLAIPGSILNPQARGCHYLLQQGAKLVTSTQDIMDELNLDSKQVAQTNATLSLATDNKNLVKCIGFEITTVDQIIARSGLGIEEVVSSLATLELEGIVKAIPGGYMRCA